MQRLFIQPRDGLLVLLRVEPEIILDQEPQAGLQIGQRLALAVRPDGKYDPVHSSLLPLPSARGA